MASFNNQRNKQVSPESEETEKVHMQQTREGLISTREKAKVIQPAAEQTTINISPQKHQDIYVKVTDTKKKVYSDQTVKFPVTSRRGHKYILIVFEVNINAILSDPTKTKNER